MLCFALNGLLWGVADPSRDAEGGCRLDGSDAEEDACESKNCARSSL